jgi:predicted Zn-dependent peptidase
MLNERPLISSLSNGIRLSYLQKDSTISHLGVLLRAGSRYEQNGEEGLAHFLEHCFFKGTENRKAYHILSRLDAVGGELNAYTAKEEMCIHASFTSEYILRATELISDILLHSIFPSAEVEKEKLVIMDELHAYKDNPSERIFDDFEAMLFPAHALGTNILGNEETIARFDRNDLLRYRAEHIFAENTVISYVGGISYERIHKLMEQFFADMPSRSEERPVEAYQGDRSQCFRNRSAESSYQAHAVMGGIAPGYFEPERTGMALLMNYLAGPALNARLILTIREKYGYAYNLESAYHPYSDTGYWSIYVGADQKNLDKCMRIIHRELDALCHLSLSEPKIIAMKKQFKGQLALSMDNHAGLMLGYGKSLLLCNKVETLKEIYQDIDAIHAKDLQRISEQYLNAEQRCELLFDVKR